METRKYTVSAKVLAAVRANLAKANAVDVSIRFRPTRRRRKACRANLILARAAVRAAQSGQPGYGICFRTGVYALSLERSLGLAGEDRSEYEAHLERFTRRFAPQDSIEKKLVRGMAEVAWRRLRAFRGQARWEWLSLEYRLRQAARERVGSRVPEAAMLDQAVAGDIHGIFGKALLLPPVLLKLHRRLGRLYRLWVEHQGERLVPSYLVPQPNILDELVLLERPAAMVGNPLLSPARIARALKTRRPKLPQLTAEGWGEGSPLKFPHPFWEEFGGTATVLSHGLLYHACAQGKAGDAPIPCNFAAFLELVAAAFGEKQGFGMPTDRGPGTLDSELRRAAELAWERLEFYRRYAEAEAERLKQILEPQAGGAPALGQVNDPQKPAAPDASSAFSQAQDFARRVQTANPAAFAGARLLLLLKHDLNTMEKALGIEAQLQDTLYRLLTQRHGVRRDFDFVNPERRAWWSHLVDTGEWIGPDEGLDEGLNEEEFAEPP